MAQPVFSTMFAADPNYGGANVFPVPAGVLWVVRNINTYVTPVQISSIVFVRGFALATFWTWSATSGLPPTGEWQGRVVIPAGSALHVDVSGPGMAVYVCGYQLTLP